MDLTKFTSGMSAGVDHMSRIEPGDYTASCVGIQPPFEYKQYARMVQRVDFSIHGDGTILKKYVNLGPAGSPWKTAPSRSEFYKLWTAAMGRRPKPGEPINLDFILGSGILFTVTVEDKKHEDGYTYSLIGKVRPAEQRVEHPDYSVSQSLSNSITQPLNDSLPQVLSHSATQDGVNKTNRAVDSGTQDEGHAETQVLSHSATQDGEVATVVAPLPKGYVFPLAEGRLTRVTVSDLEHLYPDVDVHRVMDAYRLELFADRSQCRTEEETNREIHRRLGAAWGKMAA